MAKIAPLLLGIGGDSGTGKSTLVGGIYKIFGADKITNINLDDYHTFDRTQRKIYGLTALHPAANNMALMGKHAWQLKYGEKIIKPVYDHSTGTFAEPEEVEPRPIVIIGGLFPFFTQELRDVFDLKVYLDPDEELKRRWKIQRDAGRRGYTIEQVMKEIEGRQEIARLTVTGSGGPLWGWSAAQMAAVTREEVLAHPKWRMGPKITVDSATLMNKGLELIEAQWLFDVELSRLRVVIHPEAVVHAFVEFIDGTWLAQMSPCDMRIPIQYALSFPERWPQDVQRLDPTQLGTLRFYEPDLERFPCLQLAQQAAQLGGTACVVLNGANDTAVQAYLEGHIPFAEIPHVIAETLGQHTPTAHPTLDEIVSVDTWSRRTAQEVIHQWVR